MDFSDIERILELVRLHDLAEFELERDGLKLRVRKAGASPTFHATPMHMMPVVAPHAPPAALGASPAAPPAVAAADAIADGETEAVELALVKSPLVGTFYRCPDTRAPPFARVGPPVTEDQAPCL